VFCPVLELFQLARERCTLSGWTRLSASN
jgi:hypothetical protein